MSGLRNGHFGVRSPARRGEASIDDGFVAYNFSLTSILDPRVTFRRATKALYWIGSGQIHEAPIDAPRFSFSSFTSVDTQGLLIEGGATNQCLYCNDPTNAAWVKSTMTAVMQGSSNGLVNNGLEADNSCLLTATAANATIKQAIVDASNVARTFSVFLARGAGIGNVDITLDNGTTWTPVTLPSDGSWTRVQVTQTLANPTFGIRIVTSGDAVLMALAQEEAFANATSPIYTTSAAALRAEDVATITGLNFSEGFNTAEGTFVVQYELTQPDISGVERNILSIDDNTTSERIAFLQDNGTNAARFSVTAGGVSQAALIGGDPALDVVHAMAGSYAPGDFRGCVDGGAVTTDAAGTPPTVNQMRIGGRYNSTTSHLYGVVCRIHYYATKSSDAVLQSRCNLLLDT